MPIFKKICFFYLRNYSLGFIFDGWDNFGFPVCKFMISFIRLRNMNIQHLKLLLQKILKLQEKANFDRTMIFVGAYLKYAGVQNVASRVFHSF